MFGLTSYGMYVPFNRLERKRISTVYNNKRVLPGEKAVANYDEDSLTMAVAAAFNSLDKVEASKLNAVFFASTTSPNKEKQCAAQIASVLDIDGAIRTADFGGSLRASTSAMLCALDIAAKGEQALITAADCRLGRADSNFETVTGDGAVALTFGNENVIAEYVDSFSAAHDFYDAIRSEEDQYVHFYDERFSLSKGYIPFVLESISGLLQKTAITPDQISKVVIDGASQRHVNAILSISGFGPEKVQKELITDFGYTGTAYAPMVLAGALEKSVPGDYILYVSYGEGSDAILFKACEGCGNIGRGKGFDYFKENKRSDMNYEKYLRWKDLLDFEPARRPAQSRSNLPDFYRKRKKNLAGYGSICTVCGTPQFPPSRVCINCHAIDQMEPYRFVGHKAKLATYTLDHVGLSKDSPNVIAVIDFEGGGRMFSYMMDCYTEKLEIGMPVELTYRKLFSVEGINTYFWKCTPVNGSEEEE